MSDWKIEPTVKYVRNYRKYEKKHPHELASMINNLDKYFTALKELNSPLQIKAGFIHNESSGIKAIDQKGGGQKVRLKQTRLYVYPDIRTKTLYLLTIGDKTSQKREDIKFSQGYVKEIRRGGES